MTKRRESRIEGAIGVLALLWLALVSGCGASDDAAVATTE